MQLNMDDIDTVTEKVDADRIDHEENDLLDVLAFTCAVCTSVVLPTYGFGLFTEGQTCQHLYCKDCLMGALAVQKRCPKCRADIVKGPNCAGLGELEAYLRPFTALEKRTVNKMFAKCVAWESGCSEKMKVEDISVHENQCVWKKLAEQQSKIAEQQSLLSKLAESEADKESLQELCNVLVVTGNEHKRTLSGFYDGCLEGMQEGIIPHKTLGLVDINLITTAYEQRYGIRPDHRWFTHPLMVYACRYGTRPDHRWFTHPLMVSSM
ncbi:hypothetical protein CYMTET_46198 [Cymbomonas tetramitiformis]|uniref:RING-type domain-containing protein n=1 Tax=Cymbomonas tetramitiformis TaxID=36881 RepID=A0AAE0BYH1_9CHLO|nr:hypothetical protein CYMTET_46198 [Cymbomonas tetramitiformis]